MKGRLEAAEATAAAAIAAAEALGDADAPRVGLAVACAAEQRFEAVAVAAKANAASDEAARRRRRNQTKSQTNDQNQNGALGRVSFVDGGGVMLAEGLYRNALRDLGTIRPPTATPSDPDASAGGAARWDLRLCAALAHARYARVLSAAGANRADEARRWAEAAAREWRGPPGAEKLRLLNGEGVDMSHDAGTVRRKEEGFFFPARAGKSREASQGRRARATPGAAYFSWERRDDARGRTEAKREKKRHAMRSRGDINGVSFSTRAASACERADSLFIGTPLASRRISLFSPPPSA